ncbi:hypothetical protein PS903_06018 [Pseudomonas fluorescens]|nr:hypothetical protein PS903_06018 [Pseudomonas fluorescens]
MELDLDPPIFIAKDFFARRSGNTGGLADQHRFARGQRRTIKHVPGNRAEVVAVTLGETVFGFNVAADRFLQRLGLFANVLDTEQQPQIVVRLTRVFGQFKEVATAQGRLIAAALGQLVITAMPFQRLPGQLFAVFFILDEHGVAIVFELSPALGLGVAFGWRVGTREIVVAARGGAGPGAEAHGKTIDHRALRDHAGAWLIRGCPQLGESALMVGKHQQMAVG